MKTKEDFIDILYQLLYQTPEEKALEEECRKHGESLYPWLEGKKKNFEIFSLLQMPGNIYKMSDKNLLVFEWESQALFYALRIDKQAREVKADNFHLYIKDYLDNRIMEIRDGRIIKEEMMIAHKKGERK